MERAYRERIADAQGESPMPSPGEARTGETIDRVLIPPRPRTAFWLNRLFILGVGHLAPATTERGTVGLRLVLARGNFEKKVARGKAPDR